MQRMVYSQALVFMLWVDVIVALSVASNYVNLLKVTALFNFVFVFSIKTSFPYSAIGYSLSKTKEQTYAKQGLSKLLSFLQRERQNSNLTVLKLRK